MTTVVPQSLETYRTTQRFTELSVPNGLLSDHSTKEGVWGLIHVTQGQLRFWVTDPRREAEMHLLDADSGPGIVEPTILHRVEPVGTVRFHVEFLRERFDRFDHTPSRSIVGPSPSSTDL